MISLPRIMEARVKDNGGNFNLSKLSGSSCWVIL